MMPYQRHRMGMRQKRALLDMVEDTFYFTQGKHATVRGSLDKRGCWRIIAGKLNKLGPIRKDATSWQKAWCSMKCKVREKYKRLHNLTDEHQEGEVLDPELDRITEEDWRVIKMCSIPSDQQVELNESTSTENEIVFVDSDVTIKSPPTSDEEEDTTVPFAEPGSSTCLAAKQLSELMRKPVLKQPIATITLKNHVPTVIKLPSIASTPQDNKSSTTDLSTQLEAIVKSLQTHTNMQRHMLIEMQKNNRLQKSMIHILTDIKTHLPA